MRAAVGSTFGVGLKVSPEYTLPTEGRGTASFTLRMGCRGVEGSSVGYHRGPLTSRVEARFSVESIFRLFVNKLKRFCFVLIANSFFRRSCCQPLECSTTYPLAPLPIMFPRPLLLQNVVLEDLRRFQLKQPLQDVALVDLARTPLKLPQLEWHLQPILWWL